MKATVDAAGRILVPKSLRDELGIEPGSEVDISNYGEGLTVIPGGRTAKIVERNGRLVVTGQTVVDDEIMFRLMDEGRR